MEFGAIDTCGSMRVSAWSKVVMPCSRISWLESTCTGVAVDFMMTRTRHHDRVQIVRAVDDGRVPALHLVNLTKSGTPRKECHQE